MSNWPALAVDEWRDTYATLQMWTQIVGKICLALAPRINHFWGITFQVTSRGLSTPLLNYQDRSFMLTFDFVEHQLVIQVTNGITVTIPLEPRTVADFYRLFMETLHAIDIHVHIWTVPVEVLNPIRFEADVEHRSYDARAANKFWQILLAIKPVFENFRSDFIGKCSPFHFFWGSFDAAQTRFSGRRAPERPGADAVMREAYSHEVISHGFWPGGGPIQGPVFYAYAAPEPPGFKKASVLPAAAFYDTDLSEFFLPYEAVRTASSPEDELNAFLTTTYNAAADLAHWNRADLERSHS